MVTKKEIANKLLNYLNNQVMLAELVSWAEDTIQNGDIEEAEPKIIMQMLGRMAAADVKEFGLLWEDCEQIMSQLGYTLKVNVEQAA